MIRFKNILIITTILFSANNIFADELNNDSISIVNRINADSSSTIKFIQPEGLNCRILDIEEEDSESQKEKIKTHISVGKQISYRILAFNKANQREKALTLSQQINARFPQYGAKVSSNLPYWQVWVGTFFNEEDAIKAKNELRRAFPGESMSIRKKNLVVTR